MEFGYVDVESEIFAFFERSARTELVEDVVIPLSSWLEDHTRPLQEVRPNTGAHDLLLSVKQNLTASVKDVKLKDCDCRSYLDVFTEPRRVVVSRGLCIPKGLEDGIRCQNLPFDLT